jgi:two-component system, cell cycle response regulator
MSITKNIKKEILLFSKIMGIIILTFYTIKLYNKSNDSITQISTFIDRNYQKNVSQILYNIKNTINEEVKYSQNIEENKEKIEKLLNLMKINSIKESFLIYKDDNNKFISINKHKKDELINSSIFKIFIKSNKRISIVNGVYGYEKVLFLKNERMDNTYFILYINNHKKAQLEFVYKNVKDIFVILIIGIMFIILTLGISSILIYLNKQKSYIDQLTSLNNRRYLEEKVLNDKVSKIKNITMCDIDFFKKINDTYGHPAGDFVLQELSNLIRKYLDKKNEFIRYGGEEFIILIFQKNVNVVDLMENLRKKVENHKFVFHGEEIQVTLSFGINMSKIGFWDFYEALKMADKQLYLSKEKGRNCVSTHVEAKECTINEKLLKKNH